MIAHHIIDNSEYTLLKSKHGDKAYIPAVLYHSKRRNLHRMFARARDAMVYRERIMRRLNRK